MNRKTVLITGASDGLGRALAVIYSKEYNLALCGRKQEKMDQTLALLDPSCRVYQECFDITDRDARHLFCTHVKQQFETVDILINNAGANLKKETVEDLSLDLFQKMLDLNCISQIAMIQEFYPDMKKRQSGHIINVLSSCCLFHNETMAGYTASKDAMDAVSKTLMKEAKKYNVQVLSVYPGGIDTGFRAIPNHTYMKPETVAGMIYQASLVEDGAVQELVIRPLVENNIQ